MEQFMALLAPEEWPRFALIIGSIVLAILGTIVLRGKIAPKLESTEVSGSVSFALTIMPALGTIILLMISSGILLHIGKTPLIIPIMTKLATAWLILSVFYALTQSRVKTRLLGVFLFIMVSLDITGITDQVIKTLDGFSIAFGSYSFTAYTLLKFVLSFVVLIWIANIIVSKIEQHLWKSQSLNVSTKGLISALSRIAIYALTAFVALDILGVNLTSLAVFGGAIGVGIGFGLQKIASNFISGIVLLFEKSVEVGDLVELDNGLMGYIRKTNARYTLFETFDSREIMIPNEDFITQPVTNWTYTNTQGRIEIVIGVSYASDIDKAHEIILQCANDHEKCLSDPEPVCFLTEFGDSSVNFKLYFWVQDIREGRLKPKSEVQFAIWHKFKAHDIEIPFPQRDVHIKDYVHMTEPKLSKKGS